MIKIKRKAGVIEVKFTYLFSQLLEKTTIKKGNSESKKSGKKVLKVKA